MAGRAIAVAANAMADWHRDALFLARVMPPPDPELPPRPWIGDVLGKLRRAKA